MTDESQSELLAREESMFCKAWRLFRLEVPLRLLKESMVLKLVAIIAL